MASAGAAAAAGEGFSLHQVASDIFLEFFEVAIHTLLFYRNVYPASMCVCVCVCVCDAIRVECRSRTYTHTRAHNQESLIRGRCMECL